MKKILQFLLHLFVTLTPKFHWCVLRGFPDYDDNCVAIYESLDGRACRKIIWVVTDPAAVRPFVTRPGTLVVSRGSLSDYFYSVFAKYLFITHGHFIEKTPATQVCVNLWHGIPYKAIGKLDGKSGRQDSMVVATSELTRKVFADVFGVSIEKVTVTGQARTDRMFTDRDQVNARLGISLTPATKVFLWLPTYRKTEMIGGRVDGRDSGNIFNCEGFPEADFDAFLRETNAVCLVKPHPMAPRLDTAQSTQNLLYINDQWLRERGLTLYQLAGAVDCLISDISSIVIDFLLVDKPVVLLFEDIAEYRASRGFIFSPVEDWLPARVNTTYADFIDDLSAVLAEEDRYAGRRSRLKHEFFQYDDDHSAARILERTFDCRAAARGGQA